MKNELMLDDKWVLSDIEVLEMEPEDLSSKIDNDETWINTDRGKN